MNSIGSLAFKISLLPILVGCAPVLQYFNCSISSCEQGRQSLISLLSTLKAQLYFAKLNLTHSLVKHI